MIYLALAIPFAIAAFCVIWMASSYISSRRDAGLATSEIRDEIAAYKDIFSIVGMVSILLAGIYWVNEFTLKQRAEDRQALYSALGQLVEADDKRPEISAAALLQFLRIAEDSDEDRTALVQIVAGYINEKASAPVLEYESDVVARPDIQVAVFVLSRLVEGDPQLAKLVRLNNIDLRYTDLSGLNLSGLSITNSDFMYAQLSESDLSRSILTGSKFVEADLSSATFVEANLDATDFEGANIASVDLCSAVSKIEIQIDQAKNRGDALCL